MAVVTRLSDRNLAETKAARSTAQLRSFPGAFPPSPAAPPMTVHVLLATDAKQVVGCAVSMRSILEHASPGVGLHFHVMTHGVPDRDVSALRATVRGRGREAAISISNVDLSRFTHLMRSKLVTHTTYARFLLGEVLPPAVTRCIFVDCDMVVTRDIVEAWEYPLDGRTLAAVANGSAADTRDNQQRLGLAEARYFNAGFAVIDVERWRVRDVSARALAHAEEIGDRLVLHDQDALNCALQEDWTDLPRDWNAGVRVSDWLTEDSRAVFHFWGAPKPWHADYNGRFGELYLRYIDLTAYAGQRAWDPLGLGRAFARAQRAVPFLPAVLRAVRGLLRPPDAARSDRLPRR